jgi:ATP-dependent DNA helicase UvrD/PcrA
VSHSQQTPGRPRRPKRRQDARPKLGRKKPKALKSLSREQLAAVTHPPARILVIAGAGSGKTRILTRRAAFLVEARDVQPESILAITLTNKATREMIGRWRKLCGAGVAERIHAGTFHATCVGVLRSHPKLIGRTGQFQIYDKDDVMRVITRTMTEQEVAWIKPKVVQREISVNKNHAVPVAQYTAVAADKTSRIVARVWNRYEQELLRSDALDFDDLLLRTVELFRAYPEIRVGYQEKWPHILVDEYQDTNPIQARLLRVLAGDDLMCVGDDKQVIYGFRLADVRLILDFDREYRDACVLALEENYRNSPQILGAANRLIAYNRVQRPMTLKPARDTTDGPEIQVHAASTDVEEAQWIASRIQRFIEQGVDEREIAVLGRAERIVLRVEYALAAAGINYQLVGSSGYFRRPEVRAALAHLRLIVDPRNEEAFALALGIRPKVGDVTVARITAYAARNNLTLLEAATAVDLVPGIRGRQTHENARRFGYDMLAFTRQARTLSVSELVHDVIRMPLGVSEFVADQEDADQQFARLDALREAARTYERQADEPSLAVWLQDAMLAGRDDLDPEGSRGKVTIGTIHAVKGLEWKVVIAAGFEGGMIPSSYSRTPEAEEEERRMAYVLITRATRVLIISYALMREGRKSGPSRFIREALHASGNGTPESRPPTPNTA